MAEPSPTEDAFRRAVEANTRYYEALGRVTTEYIKALTDIFGGVKFNLPPIKLGVPASKAEPAQPLHPHAHASPASQESTQSTPVRPSLVLEGAGGEEVRGVFAVSNDLGHEVSAPVMSRGAATPAGAIAFRAEPTVVTVPTGKQVLVQVGATLPKSLPLGETYEGHVSVPGLSNEGISILVRRVKATKKGATQKGATKKRTTKRSR